MRENKFRGKRADNGEWVEGIPIKNKIGTFIITEENPHLCTQYNYIEIDEFAKVIPESVGEYTGLNDKNGVEIYEGDIVYVSGEDENANIEWENESSKFAIHFGGWSSDFDYFYGKDLEVIGNIYENPELTEED